jgi:hypothetical protein
LTPLVLIALLLSRNLWTAVLDPEGWSSAADYAASHHIAGNVYAPYSWAAYLHYRNLPVRVLIDSHGDPFSDKTWRRYMDITYLDPRWEQDLSAERIDAVFTEDGSLAAQLLRVSSGWRMHRTKGGVDVFTATESLR